MTSDLPDHEMLALAVIRFLNGIYEVECDIFGDPVSALLIRRIAQGQLEGRPFDISSLAVALRLPTPTVSRRVTQLIQRAWVTRTRSGRSYQLALTPKVCDEVLPKFAELKKAIRRFNVETKDLP